MELTQEYLDNKFKAIDDQFSKLHTHIDDQTEQLARIIETTIATPMEQRFAELKDYLEVREDVQALKVDMQRIKAALHIS
jgi:hypothetical protein